MSHPTASCEAVALLGFGIANLVRNTAAALGSISYRPMVKTRFAPSYPAWQQALLTDNAIPERRKLVSGLWSLVPGRSAAVYRDWLQKRGEASRAVKAKATGSPAKKEVGDGLQPAATRRRGHPGEARSALWSRLRALMVADG